MKFTDKYLTPWGLFSDRTFEEYCSQIPDFYFRKEVPEDVLKSFGVVTSLLAHSYFNYLYIDEAYSKALRVLEMAMKIRLIELGENAKEWMFYKMSKRLLELNMFDSNSMVIDYTREVRNYFSHPVHFSSAGIVYWNRISGIPRLINELYEDVDLRDERQKLKQSFIDLLKTTELENKIVLEYGAEVYILHSIKILFVNNKVSPHSYLLYIVPLFDLTQEGTEIIVPRAFGIEITGYKYIDERLVAQERGTSQSVVITQINKQPLYTSTFNKWQVQFDGKDDFAKFLYNQCVNNSISDLYVPYIDAFQKL